MQVNLDFSFPNILNLFQQHITPDRSKSASFLIWYLENYYRLHLQTAQDSVCDSRGDKGVDGIYVNDEDETITVFQVRVFESQKEKEVGDTLLKEFSGTVQQFKNVESIDLLLRSQTINPQLSKLIDRLKIREKIGDYNLLGEFVCNRNQNTDADEYLAAVPDIAFIGPEVLTQTYISDKRETPIHTPAKFDIAGQDITTYMADQNTKVIIAAVRARELVGLDGIGNQTLDRYNVRGPLSKTKVNRQIRETIRTSSKHKFFPLFHNGITIIARDVVPSDISIEIADYYVVNGCQSLTALYENQKHLTDDLRVLTKFVQLDPTSELAETVTRFSNNQNPVKDRDFVANDPQQIRIQNEFRQFYKDQYYYEIKRGDPSEPGTLISNEVAGLLLRTFDLKEPQAASRPGEMLDPKRKYIDVFMRPNVGADRILMVYSIWEVVNSLIPSLKYQSLAKYNLTPYVLVYLVRSILEEDDLFEEINRNPERFVRDQIWRQQFRECVKTVVQDIIVDVNGELEAQIGNGNVADFDYREKMRNEKWLSELKTEVVKGYQKQVNRDRIVPFAVEWENRRASVVEH